MSVPTDVSNVTISTNEIKAYLKKHRIKVTAANLSAYKTAAQRAKAKATFPASASLTGTSPTDARRVVYGRAKVPGTITYMDISSNHNSFYLFVTITGHEIDAIEKLYLDDAVVNFGASPDPRWSTSFTLADGTTVAALKKVFMATQTGAKTQSAQADLVAASGGKWTSASTQSGCAGAFIILIWDNTLFGDGLPQISFLVRGKKVYDPRTSTTAWSNNAALCIADYLTDGDVGYNQPWSRIFTGNLITPENGSLVEAANISDQTITLVGGGTEPRYTIDGVFDVTATPGEILDKMRACMAGRLVDCGQWRIFAGAWRSPVLTLTQDDFISEIKVDTMEPYASVFNAVKGQYINASANYIQSEYPIVKNASYQTIDGEQLTEDFTYSFVTSSAKCQRLAKIELERIRQGIVVTVTCSLRGYLALVGENVALTFARYGWVAKTFEVDDLTLILQSNNNAYSLLVELTLRESASGIFDWANGAETVGDLAPNTSLPNPFSTASITTLVAQSGTGQLYVRGDGTVAIRFYVTWDALADFFVTSGGKVEVDYQNISDSAWTAGARLTGDASNCYLTDVTDGAQYNIRARAINAWGYPCAYTTITNITCVGKTAAPSNVSGFAATLQSYGIQLRWSLITDLDADSYEIRQGASWAAGTLIAKVAANAYTLKTQAAGFYNFWIKAIDTTGNYSVTESNATLAIHSPTAASFTGAIDGSGITLKWSGAAGDSAIDSFSIYQGATFSGATFLATTKGSFYKASPVGVGVMTYWLVVNDIAGNASSPVSVAVMVSAPGMVTNLVPDVVQNNVLLRWQAPTQGATNLPIAGYNIRRGATYGGAVLLGNWSGTFGAIVETSAGTLTYWVEAVDSAGNIGTAQNISVVVTMPTDFVMLNNVQLSGGTCTGCVENAGVVVSPVDSSATWSSHFSSHGWSSIQDQINAGYPLYIQPEGSSGTWEKIYDFGSTQTNATIRLTFIQANFAGTPTVVIKIAYSTDNISYAEAVGVTSLFSTAFRYVRIRFVVTSPGLVQLSQIFVRLDRAKIREVNNTNSSAGGDVTINLVSGFQALTNVALSVESATAVISVWQRVGGNPNQFTFGVFDRGTGARVALPVNYEATGY